jgi:hypothetical protein
MEKKIVEEEIATKVPPRKDYHGLLPFFNMVVTSFCRICIKGAESCELDKQVGK